MSPAAPHHLDADLELLWGALWDAVGTLGGRTLVERARGLGAGAQALRAGSLEGGRRAFAETIAALGDDELEDVARVYTQWCQLMNVAEEQQRIRVLRERGDRPPDGLRAAVEAMAAAGMSADDVRAFFGRALVMPVLTAHPTEARRRSLLEHLGEIAERLDELDGPPAGRERARRRLLEEVLVLHATETSRARRPSVRDEIEASLDVFRRTLLDVTPRIYRALEDTCAQAFGGSWHLPPFFSWGTWIGGDRDGNPNVTTHVTRAAFDRQRELILDRYLADVEALGRSLSTSERRGHPGGARELDEVLELDRERFPDVAVRARPRALGEPWREKLWYVQARLRATRARTDGSYVDAHGYQRDLELLDRTLRASGFALVAGGALRSCLRRAEVFGFHLSSIDVRQHSAVHERIVGELLERGGRPGYAALDEGERRKLLGGLLSRALPPERDRIRLSPGAQDLLATLDIVGRARHELGPRACERYIVSFTSEVSDLLEVAFLARAAGLAPGELRPVPLLEQLEDLQRAGAIAEAMIAEPALAGELGGELEVMIGYSDSGKQVGYVTSQVALRRAQLELASVAERAGLTLTVFHGRGGAIGRGGGSAGQAIRAQPDAALRGRVRVTEQGETVTARYARAPIAQRDLELTLAAVLLAAVDERQATGAGDRQEDEALLDRAAAAAHEAYSALTADRDRLARYTVAATPIQEIAKLPLGSRPASRRGGLSLDDLRAIPWVFSWTQSRHGIPGWFGLGATIAALAAELGDDGVRGLERRSPFFRALVRNGELALIRADIEVAAEYARLAEPDAAQLFELVRAEHERAIASVAAILGHAGPFGDRPHLAASVARRNPYLDVLSHVQVEALARLRAAQDAGRAGADLEQLTRTVFTTIGGIAAGLQTTG